MDLTVLFFRFCVFLGIFFLFYSGEQWIETESVKRVGRRVEKEAMDLNLSLNH